MADPELLASAKALERVYVAAERKANDLLSALNTVRAEAGLPPFKPTGGGAPGTPSGGGGGGGGPLKIESDTFFGKRQQTAVKDYLSMRKATGMSGPAKPREIYDALVAGGFKYDAKDAETALVGLRALLRKRTAIFVKVGDGAYGLTAWYPDMKKPKAAAIPGFDGDDEDDADGDDDFEMETDDKVKTKPSAA